MDGDKSVLVEFKETDAEVIFKGMWMRVDIDRAYKVMLRKLPVYLMSLKKGESDGTSSKRKRTKD